MRLWITKTLLRLLVFLYPIPSAVKVDDKVERWLAESWLNGAANRYFAARDNQLKKFLAEGNGMKPEPRDMYHIAFGQRLETYLVLRHMETCYNSRQKKLKEQSKSQSTTPTS